MTDWSIWPATNGPNTDAGDAGDISRGVIFRLSVTGWLKAIRFYRGTTNVGLPSAPSGGVVTGRLYTLDGNPVAGTTVTFSLSGTGWQQANLSVPVQLLANTSYKAVVLTGNYTATGAYFSTGAGVGGIVSGIITAPDAGGNPSGIGPTQQMSFKQPTSGLEYPNQYFNGGNYWVDVVVADADPGSDIRDVTGAASVTGLTVAATQDGKIGVAPASVPVTLDVSGGDVSKLVASAAAVPVTLDVAGGDVLKTVDDTASVPVTVGLGATVEAVGAGVSAPTSAVLCSSWANYVDVPERMRDALPGLTSEDWQRNLMLASELLWMYSGRRWYGIGCTETAVLRSMPPQQGRGDYPYHTSWGRCGCWFAPVNYAEMHGMAYRHRPMPYAVTLPRTPVTNILSVTIDGQAFTEYELLHNGWLTRLDGKAWNVCGDDTIITYTYGAPPPEGGKQAAIMLAFELGKEQVGDANCRLPKSVVSETRQGVTIQRQAATDFQALYRTGLPEVDRWLTAVNPQSRPSRARIWSPDIPSAVRTPQ